MQTNFTTTVLNDYGDFAYECKEYDLAEQLCREGFELSWHIDDIEKRTIYSGKLGELAIERKQWKEAGKWFERQRTAADEVGRAEFIAQAQYGLALAWEADGQPDSALPLAQEALTTRERLQDTDLAATRELVQRLTAAVRKSAK
jgi:tetratricopeptide (TPR) repeat protein